MFVLKIKNLPCVASTGKDLERGERWKREGGTSFESRSPALNFLDQKHLNALPYLTLKSEQFSFCSEENHKT